MGFDYALVHVKYTIPPAIFLTLLYRPLLTQLDIYKICFLVTIAVISTIPWDSYLIRNRIWTYPKNVIIGPTLFDIPVEELFFFIIQTYTTSLIYLILNKATFQPAYLRVQRSVVHPQGPRNASWWQYRILGQLLFVIAIFAGIGMIGANGSTSYMGLIVTWAAPFLLLLWTLAYQFILGLPLHTTVLPIVMPTLYLWLVDTWALQRGTWVIESETKLGIQLWEGLEIEEAVFFLVTNTLVVFGLLAFDNAIAVLDTFPALFPRIETEDPMHDSSLAFRLKVLGLPSPILLVKALLIPASEYDEERVSGLQEAVDRLKRKSRSFYFASSTFNGKLRIDLLLLYSFCRVADDLVDNARSRTEADHWITELRRFIGTKYRNDFQEMTTLEKLHVTQFPPSTHQALVHLPTSRLSRTPFIHMLQGFQMDLTFSKSSLTESDFPWPIVTEHDLEMYAARVAGTVARLCLELVFYHFGSSSINPEEKKSILCAGERMGVALQYVNIARDIAVDTKMYRVYLPRAWLEEEGLMAVDVIKTPSGPEVQRLRSRLLDKAFEIYEDVRGSIEKLPEEARGPMRVAIESYMEIGRVLRQEDYAVSPGRATVPKLRRIKVAWRALNR